MAVIAELTMTDILSDPLILALARADGLTEAAYRTMMHKAAARLERPRAAVAAASQPRVTPRGLVRSEAALCCA
ncbi:hypothetical protein [Ensifer soli]|uniref:hypothetical protein n=1 Tax=Ciceribacter sp. sgz301302 TaxID=3342379 RepID=UPI0035B9354B